MFAVSILFRMGWQFVRRRGAYDPGGGADAVWDFAPFCALWSKDRCALFTDMGWIAPILSNFAPNIGN